jgi:hypothetical protein
VEPPKIPVLEESSTNVQYSEARCSSLSKPDQSSNNDDPKNIHDCANISNIDILQDIRPIRTEVNKRNHRGRKPQRAELLTNTPIKEEQKTRHDASSAKKKRKLETELVAGLSKPKTKKDLSRKMTPKETKKISTALCAVNNIPIPRSKTGLNVTLVKNGPMKPAHHIRGEDLISVMIALTFIIQLDLLYLVWP